MSPGISAYVLPGLELYKGVVSQGDMVIYMSKIYLFDLFDTVLTDVDLSFNVGLRILWRNHFADSCSFSELAEYSEEVLKYMRELQSHNDELCYATDEISMYCKKFSVEPFVLSDDEEWEFMLAIEKEVFLPETKEVLEQLKAAGTPMYVLSNSIFRANALKRCLDHYGALSYFNEVWSSADFGKRKPAPEFFDMAVANILKDNPWAGKEDIIFVGNSYNHDAHGAAGAGLSAVWLNLKKESNVDDLPIRIIPNISYLLK